MQRQVKDAGNVALFLSMAVTSVMLLYRLPTEASFDKGWLDTRFCILNSYNKWTNSFALSFYVDVCFSFSIYGIYAIFNHKLLMLGKYFAFGSIFATAGHGMGHLHYGSDPRGMDLWFDLDHPLQSCVNNLVVLFTYIAIFYGTMPLVLTKWISTTALIFSLFHNILSISLMLMFVYRQAAIYISISLHMLSLKKGDKENEVYMI